MARRKSIIKTNSTICSGDLKKKILIQSRAITPPTDGSVDFTEVFTTLGTVWSMVKTAIGYARVQFDDSQAEDRDILHNTHDFYIRYVPWVTAEHFIVFRSERYSITQIYNLDEDNTILRVQAMLLGPISASINQA